MEGGDEMSVLQQAIGVLRIILSSPEMVPFLSSSSEWHRAGSSAPDITHSMVESKKRELFRPGNSQDTRHQAKLEDCNSLYDVRFSNTSVTGALSQGEGKNHGHMTIHFNI